MQRHITLKVNLLEEEIKTLKINSLANMGKIIERTDIFNKELEKRIRNDIITPRISNKGNYQQGSLDEKLYLDF